MAGIFCWHIRQNGRKNADHAFIIGEEEKLYVNSFFYGKCYPVWT